MAPLVSIVIPIYNSCNFLAKTVESVLLQKYQNWNLLLIDDFSSDDSLNIAESYSLQDSRISVIALKVNSGAAVARNLAIEAARGRFIAFLDSDDLWHPEKLSKQIQFMLDHDVALSFTAYDRINEAGQVFATVGAPDRVDYYKLLKTNFIGCSTAIYDTSKLGKVFMPVGTKREDFALWLNILKKIDYAYGMKESLTYYRVYENQSSNKKAKMALENWHLYRDIEKLGFFRSVYYFSCYAILGVLRSKFPKIASALRINS